MHRVIACMVLLGLFADASAATARAADSETPPRKIANEPAASPADSTQPEAREDEKDAVISELRDLRDLVQAQSGELQELRKRLAAVEAAGAASKKVRAPVDPSLAGIIQAPTSAAMSAISMPPTAAVQGTGRGQSESKSPLSFKIGSTDFTPGGFLDFTSYFSARMLAAV